MTISDTGRPGFVWSGTQWVPILGTTSDGSYIGTIVAWAGSTPPLGWQLCDGSAAKSPSLVALVGANVPDLRDRFIVGVSGTKAKGATGGAETVTLTAAQSGLVDHAHAMKYQGGSDMGGGWAGIPATNGSGTPATAPAGDVVVASGAANASAPHTNMPPYYALAWIIKHTGEAANGITMAEASAAFLRTSVPQQRIVTGVGATGGSVTFPGGPFASPPAVAATVVSGGGRFGVSLLGVTASGFTYLTTNLTNASDSPQPIDYIAVGT